MRRRGVLVLAAVVMAALIVPLAWQTYADDTRCVTTMEYDGVTYAVYQVTDEIVGQGDMGIGTQRTCGDKGPWSEHIAVSPIAGINPRMALVTPVAARVLYVAQGVRIDELPGDVATRVVP